MKIKTFIYKVISLGSERLIDKLSLIRVKFQLWLLDCEFNKIRTSGMPFIRVSSRGKLIIGDNFAMNNGPKGNPIGCFNPCSLVVRDGATLKIGNNTGISQTALIADDDITIGDNVKLGGGVKVYTTDFHSLDPYLRRSLSTDGVNRVKAPVRIGSDVFVGAFSIILKGVTIGDRAIIGAGSVVTRNIPQDEIWGGNPAKYIRKVEEKSNSAKDGGE